MWEYKRTSKKVTGLQVYKAFAFGEFSHYCYRKPVYQLKQYRTVKGIEMKEERVKGAWQYQHFFRFDKSQSWDEWLQASTVDNM